MMAGHFFVILIAVSFSCTLSTVVGSNSNKHVKIQHRTWDEAIAIAKSLVAQLTLEEKCNMTLGVKGVCVGNVLPIPRLNFPSLCFQDGPCGVADLVQHSTAFQVGINIAASWDRDLFYQRAVAIGQEFRGKGIHVALAPMLNMNRNARHGRNFEAFGADSYLAGENSFFYMQGVQDQGVIANGKPYICNEQETNRIYNNSANETHLKYIPYQGYSANLDDKTMHEIYLWPFASAVAAGVGSFMCSYNQLNGTPACQSDKALNGLLKTELEYPGFVMSDWSATKTGIESALGGLDIDMPGKDGFMGYSLLPAVQNGSIPEARINDMIIRLIAPYYLLGQDQDFPTLNLERDASGDNYKVNRLAASASMILLKNTNNALPFNVTTDDNYYIYGAAAGQSDEGYRTGGFPEHPGALYQAGGSGFVFPSYVIDPLTALMMKGRDAHLQIRYITNQNDTSALNQSFYEHNFNITKCLVFISAYSAEGSDRRDLHALNNGDQLVQMVASYCSNTIVIINSVAQLDLEAWIDHPNVTGVVWTGIPGSEYGPALVDVLFGDYNPGGKLVFTLAKNESDYGTNISTTYNSNYTEGVFLDYRHFDKYNIAPRYYFGYGLSYTTFNFSKVDISKARDDKDSASSLYKQRRMRPYANFGRSKLYEPVYEITFTVTNTGNRYGSEVPQLYLGLPAEAEEPPKILRGFERVYLASGEAKQVTLVLTQKDISYWDVVHQKWTVAPGTYTVWISTSANNADVKLQSSFNI